MISFKWHLATLNLIVLVLTPPAFSQFREEMAVLETHYENRARTVLNTVLRPFEYSLVVAVQIEKDEPRLNKIQEEYEKNYLPGMPGTGSFDSLPITNQIHELKSRVDIHLVLAPTVSKEKEDTVRSLLKIKLHLDEQAGDSITVARSPLPIEVPQEDLPSKLPELSWKMWALILILALLGLAGLMLYLSRRNEKSKEKGLTSPSEIPKEEKPPQTSAVESAEAAQDEEDVQKIDPSELLYEQKRQMLSFASQYPEATVRALSEHFAKSHERDILLMCESFGWELSKKLFAGFSPRLWGRLGHLIITRDKAPSSKDYQKALETCYRVVLARYLELGERDQSNPFGFVWKLNSNDRAKLLGNESPFSLALICVNSNKDQMTELLDSVPEDLQEAITLQIAQLQSVAQDSIRASCDILLKKLKTIQENPEMRTEGPALAAELLRALPAEKELQFFEKLRLENPRDAESVRRALLMYPDLVHVPSDIINEMGAMIDVKVFANALRLGYPEVKTHILRSLPPKRAAMVEMDLSLKVEHFTIKDSAKAQRELAKSAMTMLRARGLELGQVLPKDDLRERSGDHAA
jgi:flagellar motor switch protein FliG